MTKKLFLFRSGFWLHALKVMALLFVGGMILVHIPELIYDLGPRTPMAISSPDDLSTERPLRTSFVSISGEPDFEKAFVYKRYGLSYTYFNIRPYGMKVIVRTYHTVNDEWKDLNRFLGKLKSFKRQPFYYKIRDIYKEQFGTDVPEGAFFLSLDDVPKLSGWQVGAAILACVLWAIMFYMFYFYDWSKRRADEP